MPVTAPSRFAIGPTDFQLDGRPHRILAGALHYFRVHPDLWADRIRKARLMGLNTIETYVAWNAHEPRRGEWRADDGLDLGRFLDLVAAEGMHAIVRPGPVHLRGVGQRRPARLAVPRPRGGRAALGAALPRGGRARISVACTRSSRRARSTPAVP